MCKCISIALKFDEIHQKDNGSIFPGHKQSRGEFGCNKSLKMIHLSLFTKRGCAM